METALILRMALASRALIINKGIVSEGSDIGVDIINAKNVGLRTSSSTGKGISLLLIMHRIQQLRGYLLNIKMPPKPSLVAVGLENLIQVKITLPPYLVSQDLIPIKQIGQAIFMDQLKLMAT